jgi:hypothetical protein
MHRDPTTSRNSYVIVDLPREQSTNVGATQDLEHALEPSTWEADLPDFSASADDLFPRADVSRGRLGPELQSTPLLVVGVLVLERRA